MLLKVVFSIVYLNLDLNKKMLIPYEGLMSYNDKIGISEKFKQILL